MSTDGTSKSKQDLQKARRTGIPKAGTHAAISRGMRIKSQFRTQREAVAYLELRGWRYEGKIWSGEALFSHDSFDMGRIIVKVGSGWGISLF